MITALLLLCLCCAGCEDEKELITLGNDIPTKLQKLYMVGNASPDNWDIDYPTPLTRSEDDPYIWFYNGPLVEGEFKLCIKTGTWEQPMFHSMTFNEEIGREPVVDKPFQPVRQGGNDEKWLVVVPGVYTLSFNLRTRTYCSVYEGEIGSDVTPIETSGVYLYGSAAPTGTNLAGAEPMEVSEDDKYIFTWTGDLYVGSLRFAVSTTDESLPMIRPFSNNEPIGQTNIENGRFVYRVRPDANWFVSDNGNYTITLNLHDWTISTVYNHAVASRPIDTDVLYICGNPIKVGDMVEKDIYWLEMTRSAENKYLFTWTGYVNSSTGDGNGIYFMVDYNDWDRMIRPVGENTYIGKDNPVTGQAFSYPKCPDGGNYNWYVTEAGEYEVTVDLENNTLSITWKEASEPDEPEPDPIEADELYICGDPVKSKVNNDIFWQQMTKSTDNPYLFTWTGDLTWGKFWFMMDCNDWERMIQPLEDTDINAGQSIAGQSFSYPKGSCNWDVKTPGVYEITVDLRKHTFSIVWKSEPAPDEPEVDPIETEVLYICGNPVKVGDMVEKDIYWSEMTRSSENKYLFTWKGQLNSTSGGGAGFYFMIDYNDWEHMIRPVENDTFINKNQPVTGQAFSYPTGGNYNWFVNESGMYEVTVDLGKRKFSIRSVDEGI